MPDEEKGPTDNNDPEPRRKEGGIRPGRAGPPHWHPGRAAMGAAGVIALALLCVVLLYGHLWFSGRSIFRGVIQEQYYLLGQYAFDHLIIEDFAADRFPLWNHLNALGTPLAGNMLSAAFYPLKALIYAFPSVVTRDLYIVVRLLLAALFTRALCRRLGLGFFPAALAALSFAFTGYMKMFVNENYLNADILLPAAMLFTLRLCDERRIRDVIILALVVFCIINNGHPEAAFYTLLLPAGLAGFAGGGKRLFTNALLFTAAAGLGILLSLPMLLPFIEYWFRGYHFHVPGAGFFHYSASQFSSLISPWFFGQAPAGAPFLFTPDIAWPAAPSGMPAYADSSVPWLAPGLGAVPILLALVAASRLRELGRIHVFMLGYAVFFIGVMFGLPGFRLTGFLPVFSLSGNFKHPEPGVALCTALLAGRGLAMIMAGKVTGTRMANLLVIMIIFVLFLGVVHEPLPGGPDYLNGHSLLVLAIMVTAGVWLAFSASGLHAKTPGSATSLLAGSAGAVAVMAAMASLVADGFQQPTLDPGYEKRITAGKAMERLQTEQPFSRVYLSQDIAPPNLNIIYGIADVRVMDGVNDRRLVTCINRINGHDRAQAGTYWYHGIGCLQPMPEKLGHPLLELWGVGYALMDGPLPYNHAIRKILDQANVLAPAPGYVGRARPPLFEADAPGLLQHPPSKITWSPKRNCDGESGPEENARDFRVSFKPALMEAAASRETDGVWLQILDETGLAYARHLFPKKQTADESVPVTDVYPPRGENGGGDLEFSSLPGASRDFDQAGWSDLRAGGPDAFDRGPWEEVVRGETWLYRDPEALPRIFLARRAEPADGDTALAMLASPGFDPQATVLIADAETSPGDDNQSRRTGAPGQVRSVDYSSQRIRIEAEMRSNGWLVLSDLSYPGWLAQVDGKDARIFRADYCLRGLKLEQGDHVVKMIYNPASFRIGLWVMIGVLVSMPAILVAHKKFRFVHETSFSLPIGQSEEPVKARAVGSSEYQTEFLT